MESLCSHWKEWVLFVFPCLLEKKCVEVLEALGYLHLIPDLVWLLGQIWN